jgi:hypothetical protein
MKKPKLTKKFIAQLLKSLDGDGSHIHDGFAGQVLKAGDDFCEALEAKAVEGEIPLTEDLIDGWLLFWTDRTQEMVERFKAEIRNDLLAELAGRQAWKKP